MAKFERGLLAGAAAMLAGASAAAQDARPWMDPKLSPDARAALVEQAMTDAERQGLLHGPMAIPKPPPGGIAGAGFIAGVPRLGVPDLTETDASLGVTNPLGLRPGDGATPLPSGLALAATFNPELAFAAGAMVGREARSKGFNVLLGGGANLTREPRNGRNFEYLGEDPLLAGVMAGEAIRGTQSEGVISTTKHFALNDQETGRHFANATIDPAELRESDLLAFQIAIERGRPGAVMCGYNLVNGAYACGNDWLLNKVLKTDWRYPGWVMSDWGAVHGVADALGGLDQQSGEQIDAQVWFGDPLARAVEAGRVTRARRSDMVRRILRSMFAAGLMDAPRPAAPIDAAAHALVAQRAAQEGIALLKNQGGLLPVAAGAKRIALIGGHADAGVLSGGGSSQVTPYGEAPAIAHIGGEGELPAWRRALYHTSAPLKALRERLPGATVTYDNGRYLATAVEAARGADIAIVFAEQWTTEGEDVPDLSLPSGQDALIEAVAAANPRTVVVLETGGPVAMPWLGKVGAVLAAWYPGGRGGEAIADIVTGRVNPSGRLPVTFPASLNQVPRPKLPGRGLPSDTRFDAPHAEGSNVGYRWFAAQGLKPLFPFGYGLSYTRFQYGGLTVTGGETLSVSFEVANTGPAPGADTPQVYLTNKPGGPVTRLIGFEKVRLQPGERRRVTVRADRRLLAEFDEAAGRWKIGAGRFEVKLAANADDAGLTGAADVRAASFAP
jgi:beta-glucosidase